MSGITTKDIVDTLASVEKRARDAEDRADRLEHRFQRLRSAVTEYHSIRASIKRLLDEQ